MAITRTLLASGSSTANTTSYNTASFTHQANTLIMAWVTISANASPAPVPTMSGHGITWELQARPTDSARSLFLFVGTATSGFTGALTFTTATTASSALWVIVELTGVDLSGGTASSAIQQTKVLQATGNSTTITLDAAVQAGNEMSPSRRRAP
jgi:hypothetical protein